MQQVVLNIPDKVFMGTDSLWRIAEEAVKYGKRALIVTEANVSDAGIPKRIIKILESKGVSAIVYNNIGPGTTIEAIDEAATLAKIGKAQLVIGVGGLKTMSIARGVALLTASELTSLEFIDGGHPHKVLPMLSVPTASRDPFLFKDKIMLIDNRNRSCRLHSTSDNFPAAVFFEPGLSESIPSETFSFVVMETLMHAIEGYMSTKSNFLSESLFLKAISSVVTTSRQMTDDSADPEIHERASKAGFVTALGLSMAGPGFGTALSMIISAKIKAPRVLISAIVLPVVLEYGIRVCPEKIARIAPILGEVQDELPILARAEKVVEIIRHRIGLKRVQLRLSEFGLKVDDLPSVAEAVRNFDFISQLPSVLTTEDLVLMLKKIL
ncbi:MAG: iron-containing alcohol dehydrogenase [Spirochaetales bacterium]|nr:iron-containing alcohol dehydrogenase [Spirochaetales bacterium]